MKRQLQSWLEERNAQQTSLQNKPKKGWFDNFLLFCAGRSFEDLADCPPKTIRDYKIAGSLILIPALLALFSGNIAGAKMTDNWLLGMVGAMFFALIIFLIDRNIFVITKPRELNLAVFFRLVLILILSVVLAEPFVILIFKGAIQNEIASQKQEKIEQIRSKHAATLANIEARENELLAKVDNYKQEFVDEMGGRNGRYGYGQNARKIEELYKTSEEGYRQSQKKLDLQKLELEEEKQAAISKIETESTDISVELKALHQLMKKDSGIAIATWLIRLILILIDLIPISLKWGSKNPDLEFARTLDDIHLVRHKESEKALRSYKDEIPILRGEFEQKLRMIQLNFSMLNSEYLEYEQFFKLILEKRLELAIKRGTSVELVGQLGIEPKAQKQLQQDIDQLFSNLLKQFDELIHTYRPKVSAPNS